MPLLRYPSAFCSLCLAALFLVDWQSQAAQAALPIPPPPSKEKVAKPGAARDNMLSVPILDEPPSLTLPLPKAAQPKEPAADAHKGTVAEPESLPSLRPVPVVPTSPARDAEASSVSEIGQFHIHGADLESRNYINKLCEETAEQMSLLLHDTERYDIPLVISVKTPPNVSLNGAAVTTDIAQLAFGGFRLQITIQVRPDFNVADFRDELARMLIAERILRGHKELTTKRTRILPDWLLVGIKEAMRYRNRSRPSAVFAAVFRTGKIYSIEEILETSPGSLDALSRTIYETSCCALVLMLLDQPDGNLRMAKFLNALATESKSDREMLNRWFPGINATKTSMNKWWTLQMANLATPSVFETLGPSETAKELDQALQLHYETTPAEAPVAHVASADEESLKVEAETEAKKRSFFGRMFFGDKTDKPVAEEPLAKEEVKAASKPKPEPPADAVAIAKPEKPRPEPKKKASPAPAAATADQPVADVVPAPEKSGFRLRSLLGFGGKSAPEEDKSKIEDKPAPEPKKDDKVKPEPKKEDKPKAEPKKQDKPKPELKKEEPPKPEPKKQDKPKADLKKETKPAAEPEAEAPADTKKKSRSFFGRILGGKSTEPAEEPAKETAKPEARPKGKKSAADDKPSASLFNSSLMLRVVGDVAAPSLSLALNTAALLREEQPRYVAFLGFGKKKDPAAEGDEPPAPAPAKEDKKPEPKKKNAKPEPAPQAESKPEPKKDPKPKAKKEHLVPVTIPLSEYSRITKRSDAKKIFEATATTLSALSSRAHPLFRPLIKEYTELILDLGSHKAKNVDERLKELKTHRDQVLAQAKAVRDYLDWFEASESHDYSGLFDDYLRLPKTIDQEIPRRADPISKIVDEAEKQADK